MRIQDATRRSGVSIGKTRTIRAAAQIMEQAGVGALAVVDETESLVGVVTDRDIVTRAVARNLGVDEPVSGIMTSPVVTVPADADVASAFRLFRTSRLRRLAVVRDHRFIGMVSLDDLLTDAVDELADLARPIRAETLARG